MGRPHIICHSAAAGEIAPLGENGGDLIRLPVPNESVRAVRRFLAHGRFIKEDFDGFVVEVDGGEIFQCYTL